MEQKGVVYSGPDIIWTMYLLVSFSPKLDMLARPLFRVSPLRPARIAYAKRGKRRKFMRVGQKM